MERKTRILFVCHGNICRSAMAEYIFKDMLEKSGMGGSFSVSSAGVSSEEEGNDIYPPAKRMLRAHGIPFSRHYAHRITDSEFHSSDLVVAMDRGNYRRILSRFPGEEGKVRMLVERDVDDPWYTGDFLKAFCDIEKGCRMLLDELQE